MDLEIIQALRNGFTLQRVGRLAEAEAIYRQILSRDPNNADAFHFMGGIAKAVGRYDVALDLINRAVAIRPDDPDFLTSQAGAMEDLGREDDAFVVLEKALQIAPTNTRIINSIGNFFSQRHEMERAEPYFRKALEIDPESTAAFSGLAIVMHSLVRLDEAIGFHRAALRRAPGDFVNHSNFAYSLILSGQYTEGWAEHEWRLRHPNYRLYQQYQMQNKEWDGSDPNGRTLVILVEGGFGDTILFARFAPTLTERGAKVILLVQPELVRLFESFKGVSSVLSHMRDRLPDFDWVTSPFSVPNRLKLTVETIPAPVPYLFAPAQEKEHWRQRLSGDANFKVGLVWAGKVGNVKSRYNLRRSMHVEDLAPLAAAKGVSFYSLQKGDAAGEIINAPAGLNLIDLGPELKDFADTAAVLENLDLLISVDTSIVHLAGALARPVWTMIAFCPDWRWLLDREDTPWYPTMRLFRQKQRFDWPGVIARVAEELRRVVASRVR